MTETCLICQHAKIQAIDAALATGRLVAVVATQFRVKKLDLENHLQHAPNEALASASLTTDSIDYPGQIKKTWKEFSPQVTFASDEADECLCYWCGMSGYQRLLRAWQEANTQEKENFAVHTREFDVPF